MDATPAMGKATFKKLVCPFDLEQVFSMQYSVQGLKSVLEFILDNLGTVDETVFNLNHTVVRNKKVTDENTDKIDKLMKMIKDLNNKTNKMEDKAAVIQSSVESNEVNIALNRENIEETTTDCKFLSKSLIFVSSVNLN